MTSSTSKIALTALVLVVGAGCGLLDGPADRSKSPTPAFATIPVTGSNLYGGSFYGGILVVSHETGSISVCSQTCRVIGKTEPSGPEDLVLNGGQYEVHVVNVATGHVISCSVNTSGENDTTSEAGHCNEVGTAAR
jgi:hypothetical protein